MPPRRVLLALLAWLAPALPALAQVDPSFNLVNRSGQPIREIYVSPVAQQTWGHDLLGQTVLPDGRAFAVRLAPGAGCRQDIRVVYANGQPEERRNQDTCRITQMVFGSSPPPQSGATQDGNPSFNLVNHGSQAMREVYVSSVREQDWGRQRLPRTMNPGEHLAVRLVSGDCVNDIRVVWMDGRSEERRAQDTCRIVNMVFR
ncbi:hypothetical protein [Roseomonas sp. AR75]|uniref:hypothetical protein n=1 Tax=Roseomonas sp. AR75 TaxID=2562311 RepID=UPI0010C0BEC7|nr:hypothetical protein [Roseomonas sp. AR75]